MAGRRSNAVVCSDTCRQAKHRAKAAVKAGRAPKPEGHDAEPNHAWRGDDADGEPTELRGRLEETTRRRFEAAGINDYDEDPLAVHLLGMAHILDNPGSVAPGSLTGMGKSFRDAYKDFMRDRETVDLAKDPVAAVQDEAAQLLAGLGAA
ncbi:hypothetical protein ACTQ2Q_10240 [Atopobiaceae bacterium LCP21S3_F11]